MHLFLINISPKKFLYVKNLLTQNFHILEVWFTDQNSKPLEIEDKYHFSYGLN